MPEDKMREEVRYLTKTMSAKDLEKAIRYLKALIGQTVEEAFESPIYDDRELDEEDKLAIAEAEADIKASRVYSLEEIKKQFGDL